jgi:hypothetical protein
VIDEEAVEIAIVIAVEEIGQVRGRVVGQSVSCGIFSKVLLPLLMNSRFLLLSSGFRVVLHTRTGPGFRPALISTTVTPVLSSWRGLYAGLPD